jgi:hypothetical protein
MPKLKTLDNLKYCNLCGEWKSLENFYKKGINSIGYRSGCRQCLKKYTDAHRDHINENYRKHYHKNKDKIRITQVKYEKKVKIKLRDDKVLQSKYLAKSARIRAKKYRVPFTITYKDIIIPDICPILGIEIKHNIDKMAGNSITLDRIIPEKGYTPENIIVVSLRANLIKTNASIEEILKVGNFYKRLLNERN